MILFARSYYSLKFGVLSPEKIISIAQKNNYSTIVLTDINNTSGFFELYKLGIECNILDMPKETKQDTMIELIKRYNDSKCNGIMIQLPLPEHLDTKKILDIADENKDVDGFTTYNLGRLFIGRSNIISATPKGIMSGKEARKEQVGGEALFRIW
jgi:ribosomal protein S8